MEAVRGRKETIIIVDDHGEDLLLAERAVRQCKLLNPVVKCSSGEQCLLVVERLLSEKRPPVLILLDIVMKPISGVDVLRAMNREGSIRDIPVVMLSGIRDINSVREGYQLGAQTFLVKPVVRDDLVQLFRSLASVQIQDSVGGYLLTRKTNSAGRAPESTFFDRTLIAPD